MDKAVAHSIFSIRELKSGSCIINEGQKRTNSEFFIILEGIVELKRFDLTKNNYATLQLGKGDFFGVISAMTNLPELESAFALTPLKLICLQKEKFQSLIQKTPALALKITRSYSLLLRSLDIIQVETLGGKTFDYSQESSLIDLGFSYMKLGNNNLASYMLQKYLEMYPNGTYTQKAKAALSTLPKVEIRKSLSNSENIQYYYSGEIIFCEAELGKALYVILEGEVKIIRNSGHSEIIVNILKPGEIFGEMALLDNKPRSATAIANSKVKLAVVSKLNFESTTELNPELMTKVITFLSERIWLLHKKVHNHKIKDLNLKFADALFIFYEQFKSKLSNQTFLEYPFSPEEFLNTIGLDFGKMEALLRFVHSCDFIKIEEGKIYCTNFESLERYVQDSRKKLS